MQIVVDAGYCRLSLMMETNKCDGSQYFNYVYYIL
jgi:hypothetical protein